MTNSVNFDDILPHIGAFGRYQKLRFALLSTISGIYVGWAFGSMMFIIMPSDHWCKIPPDHALPSNLHNQTPGQLEELLIPQKEDQTGATKREKCLMRDPENVSLNDGNLIPCPYGWSWDPNGKWLLMNEFSLVCSEAYLLSLMMTVRGIAGTIGMLFLINLTDMIGRKAVIFIIWPLHVALELIKLLSPNFTVFFALMIIQTLVSEPIFLIPCVLALELVGPKQHTFIINIICMVFAIGASTYAAIAYICYSWKQQVLFYNVTFIPMVIGYFFLIDESPRWLLTKGKVDRAMRIIKKIARTNGTTSALDRVHLMVMATTTTTDVQLKDFKKEGAPQTESLLSTEVDCDPSKAKKPVTSILTLFSTKNLALVTSLMSFLWAVNMLVYVGLTYNIPNLGANRYLVFAVMALIEIPACIFDLIVDRTGRIWPFGITLLISGFGLLAASLVSPKLTGLVVALVVLSKLAITASFNIVLQVAGELFPTVLRATGCGVASTCGRIVAALAPFIAYSAAVFHALPTLIMSGMALIGGILVFFLPETMNHTLPETVEDTKHGQEVGMKSFWMNLMCHCRKSKNAQSDVKL